MFLCRVPCRSFITRSSARLPGDLRDRLLLFRLPHSWSGFVRFQRRSIRPFAAHLRPVHALDGRPL
jgi:hypothetical protein